MPALYNAAVAVVGNRTENDACETELADRSGRLPDGGKCHAGIATISTRHAVANNSYLTDYDQQQPTSFITYLDANNLYGAAMVQPLPVGNFRFLQQDEIDAFKLDKIQPASETGYIIECDLQYPQHLHDTHSDYPLAPEHLTVTKDMHSPFARSLIDDDDDTINKHWKPTRKLTKPHTRATTEISSFMSIKV